MVLSYQMKNGSGTPYIFRSYDHEDSGINPLDRNPGEASELSVSEVIQATSASPHHFKPSRKGDERFVDGSFWLNNPSWEVFNEIRTVHKNSLDAVEFLLSIGSGEIRYPKKDLLWKMAWPSDKSLLKALNSQSERVDKLMNLTCESGVFQYRRLSVQNGLEDIGLDEWKPEQKRLQTLARIKIATQAYLDQPQVASNLDECAEILVERRRQRARTTLWEGFALGIRYQCKESDCPDHNPPYNIRNDLMRHLRTAHHLPPPDLAHFDKIQRILDDGRMLDDCDTDH